MVQAAKSGRRQRIESAIAYALNRDWECAAEANRALLEEDPRDAEAANRLGKALTELGDAAGAIDAYQRTLSVDSANAIARKNILKLQTEQAASPRKPAAARRRTSGPEPVRPSALIEESGRSAELAVVKPSRQVLRALHSGDAVELQPVDAGIAVRSPSGAVIGHLEPRSGMRLRRLIDGGNRYTAILRRLDDDAVTLYVRETHRAPALAGEASFLPPASGDRRRIAPRYSGGSALYDDGDDVLDDSDDDDEAEEPDVWAPARRTARTAAAEQADDDDDADEDPADDDEEDEDADNARPRAAVANRADSAPEDDDTDDDDTDDEAAAIPADLSGDVDDEQLDGEIEVEFDDDESDEADDDDEDED